MTNKQTIQTSARNQFFGKVAQITAGAVNDEVVIQMPCGQQIVASITKTSVINLGLKQGVEAFAIVKSSMIVLSVSTANFKLSTRNQLVGKIIKIKIGAVNSEVIVKLSNNTEVATIITNQSNENLSLSVGDTATLFFKASNVIVGVVNS